VTKVAWVTVSVSLIERVLPSYARDTLIGSPLDAFTVAVLV
jgi:hypothetical protein